MMLKLYGGQRSRASIPYWYLEELGIPYEFVLLDLQQGEQRKPEFLMINPIGKVPAIVDGDFKLWESGAILLYLAEKYDRIIDSLETRSQLNQWILFANTTMESAIFVEANRETEMPRILASLEEMFTRQPYLMGDNFTVADVAVGAILSYAPSILGLDFSAYAQVTTYIQRMRERPAYQKAIGDRF